MSKSYYQLLAAKLFEDGTISFEEYFSIMDALEKADENVGSN